MIIKFSFRLLLATTLALLAANALPVESVELRVLTPDDFDSTVANGVWFVEHFSPYCGHCKAFLPTWQKLVEFYDEKPDPGIHLAQVDCVVNGDLCNKHAVTGYPQMNLYKNGEFITKYKGSREWDLLTAFLDEHAEPTGSEETTTETPSSSLPEPEEPKPVYNIDGQVLSLSPTSLEKTVNEGPVFVKFYAPWCGHCKHLAPVWKELAKNMQNRLTIAEVNCDDHESFCKTVGVQGYPTLSFFTGGNGRDIHKTEYTGGRKLEQMQRFAEMAISSDVLEVKTEQDFDMYVRQLQTLFLLLHPSSDTASVKELKDISRVLVGIPRIFSTSSDEIRKRFKLPSNLDSSTVLLAIKDGLSDSYTSLLDFPQGAVNGNELTAWLERHRLPSSLELNSETFQNVMNAPHKPLVVVVAIPSENQGGYVDTIQDISQSWRRFKGHELGSSREVIFTWMDATKWANWLKNMYGVKEHDLPAVIISDHQELIYYDVDRHARKFKLETNNVLGAVDDVLSKKLRSKSSENIAERFARRLNNAILGLERFVIAHPYLSIAIGLTFFVVFVIMIKKFIESDTMPSNGYDYTKIRKHGSRLD